MFFIQNPNFQTFTPFWKCAIYFMQEFVIPKMNCYIKCTFRSSRASCLNDFPLQIMPGRQKIYDRDQQCRFAHHHTSCTFNLPNKVCIVLSIHVLNFTYLLLIDDKRSINVCHIFLEMLWTDNIVLLFLS